MDTSMESIESVSASRNLQGFVRRHPLFCFFLLAYAISWILVIPYVLSEWGILQGDFTVMYVLHTFGPSLAASS